MLVFYENMVDISLIESLTHMPWLSSLAPKLLYAYAGVASEDQA